MNRAECDFCGLMQGDLPDEFDTEELFEVSLDGRQMACTACSIGREGFYQYDLEI